MQTSFHRHLYPASLLLILVFAFWVRLEQQPLFWNCYINRTIGWLVNLPCSELSLSDFREDLLKIIDPRSLEPHPPLFERIRQIYFLAVPGASIFNFWLFLQGCSVLTILLFSILSAELFSRREGLITAGLLAASPVDVHLSYLISVYPLTLLLCASHALSLVLYLKKEKSYFLIYTLVSAFLVLYLNYFTVSLLIAELALLVRYPDRGRRTLVTLAAAYLIALAPLLVRFFYARLSGSGQEMMLFERIHMETTASAGLKTFWGMILTDLRINTLYYILASAFFVTGLFGLADIRADISALRHFPVYVVGSSGLLLLFIGAGRLYGNRALFDPITRYFYLAFPFLLLLAGRGVVICSGRLRRLVRPAGGLTERKTWIDNMPVFFLTAMLISTMVSDLFIKPRAAETRLAARAGSSEVDVILGFSGPGDLIFFQPRLEEAKEVLELGSLIALGFSPAGALRPLKNLPEKMEFLCPYAELCYPYKGRIFVLNCPHIGRNEALFAQAIGEAVTRGLPFFYFAGDATRREILEQHGIPGDDRCSTVGIGDGSELLHCGP